MNKRALTNRFALLRNIAPMLLALSLGLGITSPLQAQRICFRPHEGLPGSGGIPPTRDGYIEPELDVVTSELETGWVRSSRITYVGDTLQPLMVLQGLKDNSQDFLYLSFDVRVDNSFDNEDKIILVFRPNFSTTGHTADERRIDITPLSVGLGAGGPLVPPQPEDTPAVPTGFPASSTYQIKANRAPANVEYKAWSTSGSGSWVSIPDLHFDIKVRSWVVTPSNKGWSVEIKLPITVAAATIAAGTDGSNWRDLNASGFGFYANVIKVVTLCSAMACTSMTCPPQFCAGGVTNTGGFAANQFAWPRIDYSNCKGLIFNGTCPGDGMTAGGTGAIGFREIPPAWLGEAVFDPAIACTGVGFENGPSGIGIRDPATPSNPLSSNIDAAPTAVNTFTARLVNTGTSSAPGVRAEFRIANWGIGGGPGTWGPIPLPTPPAANSNPTARQSIPNTGTFDLTANWTLTAGQRAQYCDRNITPVCPAGTTLDAHQCVWVLLDSNQNVEFTDSSVRRNMDFVNLSTFNRQAEISGKGYPNPPAGRTDYDFLLQVNHVRPVSLRDIPGNGGPSNPPGVARAAAGPGASAPQVSALEEAIYHRQAMSSGLISTWVWMMYGHRNTGVTIPIGNRTYPILEPVGGFGFIADHQGRAKEFKYEATGAGLRRLPNNNDDFYILRVPKDGVSVINTRLEAVDAGQPSSSTFKHWGLSLHTGIGIPHGNFNAFFNPGPNAGVDIEYRINRMFSLEGIYTFHHFNGQTFGAVSIGDLNVHQFSFNGKVYGSSSPVRPFFNFGGGAYKFDPGSTHGGLNVGGGWQFDLTPNVALDAMYNFHNVFTSGSSTRFSTLQGGVRFRF